MHGNVNLLFMANCEDASMHLCKNLKDLDDNMTHFIQNGPERMRGKPLNRSA